MPSLKLVELVQNCKERVKYV